MMRELMKDDKKKIAELEEKVVAGQNWHQLYNECAREREELRKRFLAVCQMAIDEGVYENAGSDALMWAVSDAMEFAKTGSPKSDESVSRWIPVTERLPVYQQEVLATVLSTWTGNTSIAMVSLIHLHHKGQDAWYNTAVTSTLNPNRQQVIAWRPLPNPYEEVSHG